MIELTPDEARVLGVLVEKDRTTPEQYPLTLNAVVNGANQKNNRNPVTNIDSISAMNALVGLRNKGLVIQQDGHGQRVSKFKHQFGDKLNLSLPEMVLLAELLLRGPQTLGELRGRATRMHPLDSLEMVRETLQQMMSLPEPLVRQLPPVPGSRAERFAQLLCPDLHPLDAPAGDEPASDSPPAPGEAAQPSAAQPSAAQRLARLEADVQTLRAALRKLAAQIGADDPAGEQPAPQPDSAAAPTETP